MQPPPRHFNPFGYALIKRPPFRVVLGCFLIFSGLYFLAYAFYYNGTLTLLNSIVLLVAAILTTRTFCYLPVKPIIQLPPDHLNPFAYAVDKRPRFKVVFGCFLIFSGLFLLAYAFFYNGPITVLNSIVIIVMSILTTRAFCTFLEKRTIQPEANDLEEPEHTILPVKPTPLILIFLYCLVFTGVYLLLYRLYINNSITLLDSLVVIVPAIFTALVFCSFVRGPSQFYSALLERVFRPIALILALAIRLAGLVSGLVLGIIRLGFSIVVAILYDASPLSLFLDALFTPLGFANDAVVTIVLIYFGLFGGRLLLFFGIREAARNIIARSTIKTPFP